LKTMLIMFIVGICAIGWRSPEIMQAIGMAGAAQDPAGISLKSLNATPAKAALQLQPMTADEFAKLSKTDPHAYQKFINSYQVDQERSEVDKLMNFFTRGKFE
jgi:hypothetical protein